MFKHLYISGAYYKYPNAEIMNRKEWLGTDFLIDIDADHLDIPCKQEHDIWYCLECKKEGRGTPPIKCPKCGSDKIQSIEWICDRCLRAAKNEVSKFLNNFVPQFNIDLRDINVHFSGHRGYHIIITSKTFRRLRDYERREIVDFFIDPGKEQINEKIKGTLNDIISLLDIEAFNPLNFRKNTINKIMVNKDKILNTISPTKIVYTKDIGISKNIFFFNEFKYIFSIIIIDIIKLNLK
ncbi:MAG: hypothetical protein GF317_09780 [Candidatus Lokiarchaeota archaeon]|nr:hypothetical protein [Candidatus Lokiarchaeota archaeon]